MSRSLPAAENTRPPWRSVGDKGSKVVYRTQSDKYVPLPPLKKPGKKVSSPRKLPVGISGATKTAGLTKIAAEKPAGPIQPSIKIYRKNSDKYVHVPPQKTSVISNKTTANEMKKPAPQVHPVIRLTAPNVAAPVQKPFRSEAVEPINTVPAHISMEREGTPKKVVVGWRTNSQKTVRPHWMKLPSASGESLLSIAKRIQLAQEDEAVEDLRGEKTGNASPDPPKPGHPNTLATIDEGDERGVNVQTNCAVEECPTESSEGHGEKRTLVVRLTNSQKTIRPPWMKLPSETGTRIGLTKRIRLLKEAGEEILGEMPEVIPVVKSSEETASTTDESDGAISVDDNEEETPRSPDETPSCEETAARPSAPAVRLTNSQRTIRPAWMKLPSEIAAKPASLLERIRLAAAGQLD